MTKYLGVKIISAEPMTATEFNQQVRPLVYSGDSQDGYKVVYEDGYVSWSPKDVFEKAYRPITGLTFGLAIEALKKGLKVARKGWNSKGMFVVYQKGYPQGIPCNKQTAEAWGMQEGDPFICNPYLQIKNVDGSHSMWVASINDILAEDWEVVE
jgi:hypothetical protein